MTALVILALGGQLAAAQPHPHNTSAARGADHFVSDLRDRLR